MSTVPGGWSRRGFLHAALVGGGALALAACGGSGQAMRIKRADETGDLVANLYITVLATGRVALIVNKLEFGQGVMTGYATLVADELGVPLDHVDVQLADAHPDMRTTLNMQVTGGSTSTFEAYRPLRAAAATAREMLIAAAAQQWKVPAKDCKLVGGAVVHGARSAPIGELTKLAARAEVPSSPRLKTPKEFTLIGKADRRLDARAKIDGSATFGIDVVVPGMVNAVMVHGPVFGARPRDVNADKARAVPGVIDVFATKRGVAVVAEKYWQARAAAALVEATWTPGDVAKLDTAELRQAMRDHYGGGTSMVDKGDVGDAFGAAQIKVGGVYEAPYLAHAPMEPMNATVSVTGNKAEVWTGTQSPTVAQWYVADALGIDKDDVKVHVTLAGGGFGRRLIGDAVAEAAVISKRVRRPVKLVWSRESDMTQAHYRPVFAVRAEGALRDGKVTAARVHALSQSILLDSKDVLGTALPLPSPVIGALMAMFSTGAVGDLFSSEGIKNTPYKFANFALETTPVQTKLPVASWRSVGNSVTGFVMESLVDELAVAAKQDPFVLRRGLLAPNTRQTRVLDALEKLAGWATPPPAGVGRGLARHFSFETEVGEVAEVEIVDGRIRVRRVFCVVDCGLAVNPDIVRAQMEGGIIFGLSAALDQEITLANGVVQQTNFDTYPVLRMHEAPEIIVHVLPSEERPTGVGEPGLPPIAAAVANALFALTGVRLRKLPLQRAWDERGAK